MPDTETIEKTFHVTFDPFADPFPTEVKMQAKQVGPDVVGSIAPTNLRRNIDAKDFQQSPCFHCPLGNARIGGTLFHLVGGRNICQRQYSGNVMDFRVENTPMEDFQANAVCANTPPTSSRP
ncbi:hypothetical protein HY029_06135 [Candidatus Gottesmanbacteria bacterium]|nr:hypothetical protein [Candidatus Gottesmanbacteria bacterium]